MPASFGRKYRGRRGPSLVFSSEADVNSFVRAVILDVLEGLDVREYVTVQIEVLLRSHVLVIRINGHPNGTIVETQPASKAMHHSNTIGQVYDRLQHLRSVLRVDVPFVILTSYEEWRVCWLDNEPSNERAASSSDATIPYRLPPAAPSRMNAITGTLPKTDHSTDAEAVMGNDDEPRIVCGTRVFRWNDAELPLLLASGIWKMMLSRQEAFPLVLRLATETSSMWKKAPEWKSLGFSLCISRLVKHFFVWEDLGTGTEGKAFLVSGGTNGAVRVLKFFFETTKIKARKEESRWKSVYSHLPAVAESLRVTRVMDEHRLLMPWFQTPRRTQETLDAVAKKSKEDFKAKGFRHGDVAWRNVGVYRADDGEPRAIVFDMQTVEPCKANVDWVTPALASLAGKLEVASQASVRKRPRRSDARARLEQKETRERKPAT